MTEQVTILHPGAPGGVDEYGEPLPTTPTAETVTAIAVAPGASEENNEQQSTVRVDMTVYLPTGTVVETKAQMIVRGDTYQVEGEPADWRSPFGPWRPGIVVELVRAS